MIAKENTTELNEEQRRALDELKEKNQKIINEAKKLSKAYETSIACFDKDMDKFRDFMYRMEKANSHYPFGHYANYYYKNLEEPRSESFILNPLEKNPNYGRLTTEGKKIVETQLPDYEKYETIVSENMKNIKLLIKKATTSNIIVIRIAGITEKYNALEDLNENWWCPKNVAESSYGIKSALSYGPELPLQIPYHRQLLIKYETLYNTANMLRFKLDEVEKILETINSFLPFAELLPINKIPQTIVNVRASANNESVKIDDNVEFKGDSAIGKGAGLEKKS